MAGKKKPTNPSNQNKKKKKKRTKPGDRHYCWVCGTHKAHEKFSGKGHANHMCKQCHALPVAERNEMVATRKAENMAFRHLSGQEIKWLRERMNDPRPEVRETAREVHRFKFPRYERNQLKKGLTARSLEFYINGEVWNEWGNEISVRMRFTMPDNRGTINRIDYNAPDGEQETSVNIGHSAALKFLKAVIHQLDALFWSDDLSDAGHGDNSDYCDLFDLYLSVFPDDRPDYGIPPDYDEGENFDWALYVDDDDTDEDSDNDSIEDGNDGEAIATREPVWSLKLLLTKNMGEKVQTFYNQMHNAPQDLFWSLMEWFEPELEFDDEDNGEFDEDDGEAEKDETQ